MFSTITADLWHHRGILNDLCDIVEFTATCNVSGAAVIADGNVYLVYQDEPL